MFIHGRQAGLVTAVALALSGARRYFRNWGTTKQECRTRLPGDELVRSPLMQSTEAVWINRSAAEVWPWLVQMGQDRGGLYSYEFVENSVGLHHRNADRIHPEWQWLAPGDVIRLAPKAWLAKHQGIAFSVHEVVEARAIVLRSGPSHRPWETVWSFHLIPHWDDRCRLLIRTRVGLRHPGEVVLAELSWPMVSLMTRGMLQGIRRRAERQTWCAPQPSSSPALSG